MSSRTPLTGSAQLRWELADEPAPQGALFEGVRREVGTGEFRGMEFLHVEAKRVLNEVKGSGPGNPGGLPFRWTVNPYRGCSHACSYCFARPTHTYLGLDAGTDFDQRVVVKVNAVERLRAELHPARWAGELVAMGTNTDPYQRCEGKYRLTRGLVRTLLEAGNPFSILTKSTLILRDLDLLGEAARRGLVRVSLSIGTVDEAVWRATEPGTPPPARRLRAVEQLRAAGVPCGVLIAPILPGVSDGDDQLAAVGRAVVEAGAISVGHVVLHLRHQEVRDIYLERLATTFPEAAVDTASRYVGRTAPKADRERIAATLRAAIEAAGGHLGAMEPPLPEAPAVRTPAVEPPSADQLALPL
ncbi:MAG TPA: radical SAM protein [Aquihabitans sp.]|jgi:DNA repair photolyase|nr:radical SAM protein [Aquihabitans sp.]